MTTLTVEEWLESLNLAEYASVFIEEGYDDMNVVLEMTEDDLTDLQSIKKGHIKKILLNIQNLKESGATFTSGASTTKTTTKKPASNKPTGVQGIGTNKNGKQAPANSSSKDLKAKFENAGQTTNSTTTKSLPPKPAVKSTPKEMPTPPKKQPSTQKVSEPIKREPTTTNEDSGPQPLKERTMSLKNKAAMFEQAAKQEENPSPQKEKPAPKRMDSTKLSFLQNQESPEKGQPAAPRGKVANDYTQLFGTIRPNSKVIEEIDDQEYDSTLSSAVNTPTKLVRALGDYKAETTVELSFKEGDVVCVLEEHQSGWWKGYLQNRPNVEGLFPSNYFEEVTEEDLKKKPMKKQASKEPAPILSFSFGEVDDSPVPTQTSSKSGEEDKSASKKTINEPAEKDTSSKALRPSSSKENLGNKRASVIMKQTETSEKKPAPEKPAAKPENSSSSENLVKKAPAVKQTTPGEQKSDQAKPQPPKPSSSIKDRAKFLQQQQQHQATESPASDSEPAPSSTSSTSVTTSTNESNTEPPEQEAPKPKKLFGVAVMPGLPVKQTKPVPKSESPPSVPSETAEPSRSAQPSHSVSETSEASNSSEVSSESTAPALTLSSTPPAKPLPVPVKKTKSS